LDEKARRGLALQVGLDRAGFSPGEIDGAPGVNTDRAMAAFTAARGGADLGEPYQNPVVTYAITAEDVAGPFLEAVPEDMMEKAKLQSLTYLSVVELLAERFHASPKLLQRLNPAAKFVEGEQIVVPNVTPFSLPVQQPATAPAGAERAPKPAVDPGLTVTVTDRTRTLEVRNAAGDVLFHAPVTTGSEHDPLPLGEWKVNGVSRNPSFLYNPKLFWDAEPSHAKAKIPAGPNNPVGVAWIDLSKEHYGIHGTPEPSRVGYTESHGCIRLTNWDVMRLAELVGPGTKVILR
jgi:lipoprotein-anchoring transpeptidase ErfK/SrfK